MTCSTTYCLYGTLTDLWNVYLCVCVCVCFCMCVYVCVCVCEHARANDIQKDDKRHNNAVSKCKLPRHCTRFCTFQT